MSHRSKPTLDISETGEFLARSSSIDPRLGVVLRIARGLSAPMRESELLQTIMRGVTELLDAERSSLFLLTPDGQSLRSTVAEGDDVVEIRLPVGEGLAGWVAHTGRDLNIRDVYLDQRFDPDWDRRNNFRTRSMLCQAIRHRDGTIVGVAQAINKKSGFFSVDDEMMMRTIMAMAAIAIVNGQLTHNLMLRNLQLQQTRSALEERVREIDLLYHIEREVSGALTLESALELLLFELQRALPCDVAQVTLSLPGGAMIAHRLHAGDQEIETRAFDHRAGFAGKVLAGGLERAVCGGDREQDAELADEEQLGFVPATGLTMPLRSDDATIGALGLYGRRDGAGCFDEADIKLISVAAASVARIITRFVAREEEDRQDRLASLGSALSMVLHDFKTPMTIASGYVQLMAQSEDASRRGELAGSVMRQLERVVQMSREVLDFARGRSEVLVQKVMLGELEVELRELCEPIFAGHDVEVAIELNDRGVARLDRFKLLRVVQNLARNAREAMTDPATGHATGHFRVRIDGDGDDLVFRFSDDGPGVPAAFRHRMFEAFATHGKKEGTGLGLAMVRQFADRHGGSVRYEDTEGGGATFVVRIPREASAKS